MEIEIFGNYYKVGENNRILGFANVGLYLAQMACIHAQKRIDRRENYLSEIVIALNAIVFCSSFFQAVNSYLSAESEIYDRRGMTTTRSKNTFCKQFLDEEFECEMNIAMIAVSIFASLIAIPLLCTAAIKLNRSYLPIKTLENGSIGTNTYAQHAMQVLTLMNLEQNVLLSFCGYNIITRTVGVLLTIGYLYSSHVIATQKVVKL